MSIIITVTPPVGSVKVLDPIGLQGAVGSDGWTPILAVVADGARRVQQVVDWSGGVGIKPAVGEYVGTTGLVAAIADGVDIRGSQGVQGPEGAPGQVIISGGSILTGNGVPSAALGVDGDIYIDNLTADLYQKQTGAWVLQTNIKGPAGQGGLNGDPGPQGIAGSNGSTFRFGSGLPAGGLGALGDQYLDTATYDLYSKTGLSAWTLIGNLKGANGATIRSAAGVPSDALGVNGDYYIDTSTGDLYSKVAGAYAFTFNIKGPQGLQGLQGIAGPNGAAGASTLFGTTDPAAGLGADGDSFINSVSYHLFTKAAGAWTDRGSLKGPAGADGIGNAIFTGIGAPSTIAGSTAGDIYIDVNNGDVYQKVGAAWPGSPVMNIKGPQGNPGAPGAPGNPGTPGTNGANFLTGTGIPNNALGFNGDTYMDRATGLLYAKAADVWTATGQSLAGPQGVPGAAGNSSSMFYFNANPSVTSGSPGNGYLAWNNATQISATTLLISHLTSDSVDAEVFWDNWELGSKIIVQDKDSSPDFQTWQISGAIIKHANSYVEVPVTFIASGGEGTTNFPLNDPLLYSIQLKGQQGNSFLSGSGAPGAGLGKDGDTYLNTANGDVYGPKAAGAWGAAVGNLKGPIGNTGPRGAVWFTGAGAPGTLTGQANGDFYLRQSNGEVYQLVAGTWTDQGFSIRGPQGVQGIPGAGVPIGGTTGQALIKLSNADYDSGWGAGGGGGASGARVPYYNNTGYLVGLPLFMPVSTNTQTLAANRAYLMPFTIDRSITITDLYFNVATAASASNIRLLIYNANNPSQAGMSGGAIVYNGGLDTTSLNTTGTKTQAAVNQTLTAGTYFLVLAIGAFTGAPVLRSLVGSMEGNELAVPTGGVWNANSALVVNADWTGTPPNPMTGAFAVGVTTWSNSPGAGIAYAMLAGMKYYYA